MIGTHDSLTFNTPRYKIFNLFKFLWRTQTKSIEEQIKSGVTYFDIRVRRDKNVWRVCHGLVDFKITFDKLDNILFYFAPYDVRLILEKGNTKDEELFIQQIKKLNIMYHNLNFAAIKKGWKVLVNDTKELVDYTFLPFLSNISFWQNIKRGKWMSTIKKWAKSHNPIINKDLINDTKVHFVDYV